MKIKNSRKIGIFAWEIKSNNSFKSGYKFYIIIEDEYSVNSDRWKLHRASIRLKKLKSLRTGSIEKNIFN